MAIPRGSANRDPIIAQASGTLPSGGVILTVPAGQAWVVNSMFGLLTTTSTVGNRRLHCQVRDDANVVVGEFASGVDVAASLTVSHNFRSVPGPAALVNGSLVVAAAQFHLLAGWDLRFFDFANVDNLDTILVSVMADMDVVS